MYDYKTMWHTNSDNVSLVINEEKKGWKFMQVVPSYRNSGYDYWFRRSLCPIEPAEKGDSYSHVVC